MSVAMQDVMKESGVAFGTSGARGLVSAMTDRVCYVYARSFIKYCEASYKCDHTIAIAGDLRPSTERILKALVQAGNDAGWKVVYCGRIPSPAIALYGLDKHLATIMVTGSHSGRPQRHQVQSPERRNHEGRRTGDCFAECRF